MMSLVPILGELGLGLGQPLVRTLLCGNPSAYPGADPSAKLMVCNGAHQVVRELARVTTLTGPGEDLGSNVFTKRKSIAKKLLDPQHKIFYLCPFTAAREEVQRQLCESAGLFQPEGADFIVGLDLEYSGPVYPSKRKKAVIYDASVLILSTRTGTVVYNLFQYQDYNTDCVHFPNPFLPRVLGDNGKWGVVRGRFTHGEKWVWPKTLVDFFNQPNLILTGKSVKGDITRLNNVFCNPDRDTPLVVKTWEISDLVKFEPYKTQKDKAVREKKTFANGLSDWYVPNPPPLVPTTPVPTTPVPTTRADPPLLFSG